MAQIFLPNAPQIIYHILLNTHESPCPATPKLGYFTTLLWKITNPSSRADTPPWTLTETLTSPSPWKWSPKARLHQGRATKPRTAGSRHTVVKLWTWGKQAKAREFGIRNYTDEKVSEESQSFPTCYYTIASNRADRLLCSGCFLTFKRRKKNVFHVLPEMWARSYISTTKTPKGASFGVATSTTTCRWEIVP